MPPQKRFCGQQGKHPHRSHGQKFLDVFPGEKGAEHDGHEHGIAQTRKFPQIHALNKNEAPNSREGDQ